MTKVCNTCQLEKLASEFHRRGPGLKSSCKSCRHVDPAAKAWRQTSPKKRATDRAYLRTAKGRAKQRRDNSRRSMRPKTLEQRLAINLRCRLLSALKHRSRRGSAVRDLGCTVPELRAHLESKFAPGMTWENWGKHHGHWQIDHVRPFVSFDLSDPEQARAVCHYTNLQPLWYEDHVPKSAAETREFHR